jgi:hypothetical protein
VAQRVDSSCVECYSLGKPNNYKIDSSTLIKTRSTGSGVGPGAQLLSVCAKVVWHNAGSTGQKVLNDSSRLQ